ncbi:hypothetical protein [Streptomyces noursei]|uniref:hypothetical protein n=1 Tax=Streptomyces noursei TaxID=1971 RepID=UPI0035D844EA
MTESIAARMTAAAMDRDRAALARDAHEIAQALQRFAKDVDMGIATGDVKRIAQEMQQLLVQASRLSAAREISELYAADRATEKE